MDGKLYIGLVSVHGLVRGQHLELGRDADTGGQILYIIELARNLARHPDVERVDVFTRRIMDTRVDEGYAQSEEDLGGGARIVRLPCGPRRYLRKESLWPYLPDYVDEMLRYFRGLRRMPDLVHGHYADAGYVGAQVSRLLECPFIFTGHSLGRVKRQRLLEKGADAATIDRKYRFSQRVEAEEFALDTANMVVASTAQEVEEQYALYDCYHPEGMRVIPPGVDVSRFSPPEGTPGRSRVRADIERFLQDPDKPMILAMARADERKNFETLIKTFGEHPALRERANLVLIMGCRGDMRDLDQGARRVLGRVFYLIDRYDLYGSVAVPKHHESEDVPEIYRLAAASRGVFVNPALTEPFGLTLIEAAASGLPVVATHDGGPRDIIEVCRNGYLINPLDVEEMAHRIQGVLEKAGPWDVFSRQGVEGAHAHYSWARHVDHYLNELARILGKEPRPPNLLRAAQSRLPTVDRMLVTDIDDTLTGDEEGLKELLHRWGEHKSFVGLGIATGRNVESAKDKLREIGVPPPEILITSAGAEIHYGKRLTPDHSWTRHIGWKWHPEAIRELLDGFDGLYPQLSEEQHRFKISYTIDRRKSPSVRRLQGMLRERGLRARAVYSHGLYLDLLPVRASTGLAIRYIGLKWGLEPQRFLAAGDSGNDEDMLGGRTLGVVVGNFSPELGKLRGRPRIYFAKAHHARGILEGIDHYNFFGDIRVPDEGDA